MRIVQLIDSLDIGGAEKMAVNYANALESKIEFSGIISSRKKGNLYQQIQNKDKFICLDRKASFDLRAILLLKKYLIEHSIQFIHTHGTSYFIAFCLKLIYPKVKILWHDHNGNRENTKFLNKLILKLSSYFFSGIIVVNENLNFWAKKNLQCKNVIYLPNFTTFSKSQLEIKTKLKGNDGKRIVCVANLRHPKNHFFLIKVAEFVAESFPEWSFHCVGNNYEDEYSTELFQIIADKKLSNVFFYGSRNDMQNILNQCEIGVLTSSSEGLPVSLIEYGMAKLAVVSTEVGEIPNIIKNNKNGAVSPSNDPEKFFIELSKYMNDNSIRLQHGNQLYDDILKIFSKETVISDYLNWIEKTMK